MDPIKVTLKREEVSVLLETEGGGERKLMLREMVGKARDAHLQAMSGKMKVSPKGEVIGVKDFNGLQADLLARCLYDEEGKLIDQKEIQTFPTKTQIILFEAAQKINGLDLKAKEEAKND